jgi:hypothetical protein
MMRALAQSTLLAAIVADAASAQLVAPPFSAPGQPLSTLQSELAYSVDLGALPLRPRLIVEATPDAAHPDLELEVEISGCTLFSTGGLCPPSVIASGVGAQTAAYDPFFCEVRSEFVGETCEVRVRPLAFGAAGKPATVDVTIRGETRVPTGLVEVELDPSLQPIALSASKDTTLYQANPNASNGLGESIWVSTGTGPNALHGLLDFPIAQNVPANVVIDDVRLELSVLAATPGASLALYAVPDGLDWAEGFSDAAGDESIPPAPGVGPHASWSFRRWTIVLVNPGPWLIPGGDREPTPLVTATVSASGGLSMSSPALADHLRALQSGTTTADGFLLVPLSGSARLGSAENPLLANRPQLVVEHRGSPTQSTLNVGTAYFFNEGQNFRWTYDAENDHVVTAAQGTTCVALTPLTTLPEHNYTQHYLGDPAYRGLDCCTWQIGSTTGVTGTGQAVFYIGVDANDPLYDLQDPDGDEIVDPCDNCPTIPNGPGRGTCLFGPSQGAVCGSDQDCGGAPCSLAQEDLDRDGQGDACVPEPGSAAGLAAGLVALAVRARRRPDRRSDRPARG